MTEVTGAVRVAGRDTANKGPRGQEAWADYAERIYLAMRAASNSSTTSGEVSAIPIPAPPLIQLERKHD